MKLTRRAFTLLEMVIGIALASILLMVLFSSLRQTAVASSKMKTAQKIVHQRLCMQLRLSSLFDALQFERKKVVFYTGQHPESISDALYFSYKQEVDADPDYIGTLNAAIFLKYPEKQLCLQTYSVSGGSRREIFLEELKDLSFQFLDAQKGKWESHWSKGADFSPALLKIAVTEKNKNLLKDSIEFAFSLNGNTNEIIYLKEVK
ncbi:MAG TPA: prepilin-type N-terminal cleavage/methylation domain-containing protein [Rhabdochlamydiaceae bacterium]|nr:prepilin-type N-terminal cleavage/methylation domain-containing protein [Rhabdochlamydiaceae bacterium]